MIIVLVKKQENYKNFEQRCHNFFDLQMKSEIATTFDCVTEAATVRLHSVH